MNARPFDTFCPDLLMQRVQRKKHAVLQMNFPLGILLALKVSNATFILVSVG